MSTTYDPHQHAHELGLQLAYQPLRTAWGLYVPDHSLIILRPRMRATTERCVLAHEIGHHLHGDRPREDLWSERQERRADEYAARQLIDRKRLREAALLSPDPGQWALELGVTGDILTAYLARYARAA